MKVVIGGGAGYVGRALADSLAGDGHEVVAVSRRAAPRARARRRLGRVPAARSTAPTRSSTWRAPRSAGRGGRRGARRCCGAAASRRTGCSRAAIEAAAERPAVFVTRLGNRLLRRLRRRGRRRDLAARGLVPGPAGRRLGGGGVGRAEPSPCRPDGVRRRPGRSRAQADGAPRSPLCRRAGRRRSPVVSLDPPRRPRSRLPARDRERRARGPRQRRRPRGAAAARGRPGVCRRARPARARADARLRRPPRSRRAGRPAPPRPARRLAPARRARVRATAGCAPRSSRRSPDRARPPRILTPR